MAFRVNYISNLPLTNISGGWSGINHQLYKGLSGYFDVNCLDVINPPQDKLAKGVSKIKRVLGGRGNYHFFSERRLAVIASEYETRRCPEAELDFFLGATPWCLSQPSVPYMAYLDAIFINYLKLYNDENKFSKKDIDRLARREAAWLRNAKAVFFSSHWAAHEATRHYSLTGENFHVVGVGGNCPVPDKDSFCTEHLKNPYFLLVTTDFNRKGGRICVDAFTRLRERKRSNIRLVILGRTPPPDILKIAGVEYHGFLKKDNPREARQLYGFFSGAIASLLPTSGDTTPTSIIELGYFGCPTIASNAYGIPELIRNGRGKLLSLPVSPTLLAESMQDLLSDQETYMQMRARVRDFYCSNFTWNEVLNKIIQKII